MRKITYLFMALLFASCGKVNQVEALMFGTFYSECFGENCIEIFKLQDGKLYEDTNDEYPSIEGNQYDWVELSSDKYILAEDLKAAFPADLKDESEIIIGMPDAGDWGGVFVGLLDGTDPEFWIIDNMKDNIPLYLYDFIVNIQNTVTEIQ